MNALHLRDGLLGLCCGVAVGIWCQAYAEAPGEVPGKEASKEAGNTPSKALATYLEVAQGKTHVAQVVKPWHAQLSQIEIAAMGNQAVKHTPLKTQREDFNKWVQTQIVPFTDDEQQAIERGCRALQEVWGARYPGLFVKPWQFVKFSNDYVAGFPHTHGEVIYLGAGFSAALAKFNTHFADDDAAFLAKIGAVLLHEQLHVCQRLNPEWYAAFYQAEWGWQPISFAWHPPLRATAVSNPDAPEWGYALALEDVLYMPWTKFETKEGERPRMGRDFRPVMTRLKDDDRDGVYEMTEETTVLQHGVHADKMPAHGRARGGDHPHEIFAYAVADQLLHATLYPDKADALEGSTAAQRDAMHVFLDKHYGPSAR